MTIYRVDFPIENGGSFHCYVSLPECISSLQPMCLFCIRVHPTTDGGGEFFISGYDQRILFIDFLISRPQGPKNFPYPLVN